MNAQQAPAALLFDLEGTLLDSTPALITALNTVVGSGGVPSGTWSYEELRDPVVVTHKLGQREQELIAALRATPVAAFPGVVDQLQRLQSATRLGLITNSRRSVASILLESSGLAGFFSVVITADDVALPKPDPEGVLVALAKLGVAAQHAVVVGDTRADIDAAQAAGVRGIIADDFWSGLESGEVVPGEPTPARALRE